MPIGFTSGFTAEKLNELVLVLQFFIYTPAACLLLALGVVGLFRWHRDQLHRALIREIEQAGMVYAAACEVRRARELEQAVCALESTWQVAHA